MKESIRYGILQKCDADKYYMRANEIILEAPMNPGEFTKAIDTGHSKGVLVGFEFECCIPKESIGDPPVPTVEDIDDKIGTGAGFFAMPMSEMSMRKFSTVFKLRPGTSSYSSVKDAVKKVVDARVNKAKKIFELLPEEVKQRALRLAGPENSLSPLKYLKRLAKFVVFHPRGDESWSEHILITEPGRVMEKLLRILWYHVIRELAPDLGDKPFSHYFQFDPETVTTTMGLPKAGPPPASSVLKPAIEQMMGANVNVFTRYHQTRKDMSSWYIEPDGSLHPTNDGDQTAEVVSPPLPAKDAIVALKNFFALASQMKLYANESTGLHINVSIPEKIDLLKLAIFTGDQYVLKKYDRMDSDYAQSVTQNMSTDIERLGTPLSQVNTDPEKNIFNQNKKSVEIDYRELARLANDASDSHTASISSNGKWISFRHVGGNYLKDYADIFNIVGRFVRAIIIASDPALYRNEYFKAISKISGGNTAISQPGSLLPEIRRMGLPVLEFSLCQLNNNFDIAMEVILGQEGLSRLDYTIVWDQVSQEDMLDLFKSRANPSGSFRQNLETFPFKYAFATVVPTNLTTMEEFKKYTSKRGVRVTSGYTRYFLAGKRTVTAKDPNFKKYVDAIRTAK